MRRGGVRGFLVERRHTAGLILDHHAGSAQRGFEVRDRGAGLGDAIEQGWRPFRSAVVI